MYLSMNSCDHLNVECINPYELIRKYRCETCSEIMMCSCEKERGERFLPHQITQGCILETQQRVPVTGGFQDSVCPECRGNRPIHAPKASMLGATSKVSRYYWREIQMETTKRFYDQRTDLDPCSWEDSEFSYPEERAKIEKDVLAEIKEMHRENPKYTYTEKSQSEILEETGTEVILVKGEYLPRQGRKAVLRGKEGEKSVEEFATEYFSDKGYSVEVTESVPFHVIFGVYMSPVIQDPSDPLVSAVNFGDRNDFDTSDQLPQLIETLLPSDFGTAGYFSRRGEKILQHISKLRNMADLYQDWLANSEGLRQYLWAHRPQDVSTAGKVVQCLSDEELKKVLLYLSRNYWANFCGWPDLLVHKENESIFVEVKSSNDKLSEEQKNWLLGNAEYMRFEAIVFKVGR